MLCSLQKQGVTSVVATPHFYAWENTPNRFRRRREEAWSRLKTALPKECPEVHLGAEVCYFEGICQSDELPALCVEHTNVLLLEMPTGAWSNRVIDDLLELAHRSELTVVLAHAERYLPAIQSELWQEIDRSPLLVQSNASFFLRFQTKRKALHMLQAGQIHLLGSDCHGSEYRPPRIGAAALQIENHLGKDVLVRLDQCAQQLLKLEGVTAP